MFGNTEASFELKGDDEDSDAFAISIAQKIAIRLMQDERVRPRQILGLGHALFALERLPAATSGTYVEYGVSYRSEGDFRDMWYVEFRISEDAFEILRGGSIDSGQGHDSYSDPGWYFDVYGNREAECDLCLLEDEVLQLLDLGGEIRVYNESDIDFRTL